MAKADKFQEYDYGLETNLERYGQDSPPVLDLADFANLKIPTAIFCGKNDELAVVKDCRIIKHKIGKVSHYEEIHGDHMTFFIAKDGNFFSKTAMDMINKVFPTQDEFRIQAAKIEFDGSDFLQ